MGEWKPIATAPRDGTVFIACWNEFPQFVAWLAAERKIVKTSGPFWRRKTETEYEDDSGFRVLILNPRSRQWAVNAGIAPFTPSYWRDLPPPPQAKKIADSTADSPVHNTGDKHASA